MTIACVVLGSGGGGTGYFSRFDKNGHIVRAGRNYKFDGAAMR